MSDLFFFKDDHLIHKAKQKPWQAPKEPRFQDEFDLQYSTTDAVSMPDNELVAGQVAIYDVECFPNFFSVSFLFENDKVMTFEQHGSVTMNLPKLEWIIRNFCLVGYYSKSYDIIMVLAALQGKTCKQLHTVSQELFVPNRKSWMIEKKYKLPPAPTNHIDLIEVAPLRGSLKLYAGRLHTRRMQDLPVDPMKALTPEEIIEVKRYCGNDLFSTKALFKELEPQMLLRLSMSRQYGVDLRSKSDAQIAEAVISSELNKLNGTLCRRPEIDEGTSYRYNIPKFITYRTPILQEMLDVVRQSEFFIDGSGYIDMPKSIGDLKLAIGSCVYRMGIGGLHSTEKTISHKADENTLLLDRDVVSYYPSIILNQRLYPKHLGHSFLSVYKTIVTQRIEAKQSGNKVVADSLKISINGSFGKLGSKWSVLYAPDLMIQVTITGQLALLMLIEMIEDLGIPVVSANTDGVAIACPKSRYDELQARIAWWEAITGFETEEERYRAIYSRDVNNYIAHKETGGCKVKGTYAEKGSAGNSVLSKNPENLICNDAAIAMIEHGTPVEETIRGCQDIRRFVTIRNVTGGARKSQAYLGKVIRWYYSTEMKGEINRATKGDKIPNSDGARPLMELPDVLPSDIDYDRYVVAAMEILYDIGHTPRPVDIQKLYPGPLFELEWAEAQAI